MCLAHFLAAHENTIKWYFRNFSLPKPNERVLWGVGVKLTAAIFNPAKQGYVTSAKAINSDARILNAVGVCLFNEFAG